MAEEYIDDLEQQAPDVIDSIYKSMSQIIESLNTDNAVLNKQVEKLRNELDFMCSVIIELKNNNDVLVNKIEDLKKYTVDTRVLLMQLFDLHTKQIKKELSSILTVDKHF